jgi:transposase-like protein
VKETNLWKESFEGALRERARELIEQILGEEVEAALGAGRGRRVAARLGYRHGNKPRRLALRSGVVELRVPRARLVECRGGEREWRSALLPRYRRSSPEVEQAVVGVYLAGGNTRRIRTALQPLVSGAPLSKSAVSRLVSRLQGDHERWRQRDLAEDGIVYLYLDAIYPKVRSGGKVVALPVLVALGVKSSGEKALLALATGGAESGAAWQMVLEDLAARHVGRPRLIISDGNPGLKAALERVWSGVAHQRCTVHKLRNLLAKAPKHAQETVHEDYNRIVYAPNRSAAVAARQRFLVKWRKLSPAVAASLEEAGEELLTFYEFPLSQHRSLRTTNVIERLQQAFRRRVKTQASLPSEKAVLLLFFALFASGQMRLRRLDGWWDLAQAQAEAA